MANMQVLNSTAKHAFHVFTKNRKALAAVKPNATQKCLTSVNNFVRGLDLCTEQAVVTKGGKFTRYGKEQLAKLLKRLNLSITSTWQDVANRVVEEAQTLSGAQLQPVVKALPKELAESTKTISSKIDVIPDVWKNFQAIG